MIVKGNTVYLRNVREADLDWVYERLNDVELRGPFYPISISSETEFKKNFREDGFWSDRYGILLICNNEDGRILGLINRFRTASYRDSYEIGYRLLDMNEGGRGVTAEALMLLTYVLFVSSPVHRLELFIVPGNGASRRVAEKCGYQLEGTAREAVLLQGKHEDMLIYSILRQEAPATMAEALARLNPA